MEPAPDAQQRENIFRSALRAADHGKLRPWRYLLIEGSARQHFAQVLLHASESAADEALNETQQQRILAMPLRAPLIVVAITCLHKACKIPLQEQRMSTAAGVQALLTAAFAEGVGAYWRTGMLARDRQVARGLGLNTNEEISAFIYLGTPKKLPPESPPLVISDYFSTWSGVSS